jgi:hypothetical protein
MKTRLLSTFPDDSLSKGPHHLTMRRGKPGRKHAIECVELRHTDPQPTARGVAEFKKLRLSFRTAGGQVVEIEGPLSPMWNLLDWASGESISHAWVNPREAKRKGKQRKEALRAGSGVGGAAMR